jgi:transposase-like protein
MTRPGGALVTTILFIPLSVAEFNLEADWAEAGMQVILRHCPICSQDSIVGHGRRRKQAHDQSHDWIGIRRGLCSRCGKTFTFLPPFSPPYGHYSSLTRSQALRRRFLDGRSWEAAAPTVKGPDRVGRSLHAAPMVQPPGFFSAAVFFPAPDDPGCRRVAHRN